MPQRAPVRVASDDVQGPGSYVLVRPALWGDVRPDAHKDVTDDEYGDLVLAGRVVGWNWSDADGRPFPLPRDDRSVINRLTEEEIRFLVDATQKLDGRAREAAKSGGPAATPSVVDGGTGTG